MRKHASNANVRHYVIYDFEGKAPGASTVCASSWNPAAWLSGSSTASLRPKDFALQIAHFCTERGGKVEIIRGRRYAVK